MPWSPPTKLNIIITLILEIIGLVLTLLALGIIPAEGIPVIVALVGTILCIVGWVLLIIGVMVKGF